MLSVKQAAERAGVSESLVYDWCAEGLPHYRLGKKGRRGKIAIAETDLDAFLTGFRIVVTQPAPVKRAEPTPAKAAFKHLRLT